MNGTGDGTNSKADPSRRLPKTGNRVRDDRPFGGGRGEGCSAATRHEIRTLCGNRAVPGARGCDQVDIAIGKTTIESCPKLLNTVRRQAPSGMICSLLSLLRVFGGPPVAENSHEGNVVLRNVRLEAVLA